MQLFVHITSQESSVTPILHHMMERGITGASVLDCEGMLSSINADSEDAPPIFGSLRQYLNPQRPPHKMIIVLLKDEDIAIMKSIIHEVSGSLKLPNTGIFFTLPVTNWEGVSHK